MAVGSERVRDWCAGGLRGLCPITEKVPTSLLHPAHAGSIIRHTLSQNDTHMLGTHPLTDRLVEAPPQLEALVWTHVPGHSQEEGSRTPFLEPRPTCYHIQGPQMFLSHLYRGGSDWFRITQGCLRWELKLLLPFRLVFTPQSQEGCEWAGGWTTLAWTPGLGKPSVLGETPSLSWAWEPGQ